MSTTSPRTGERRLSDVLTSTPSDVAEMCEQAAAARDALAPLDHRAALLLGMADAMEEDGEEIVRVADEESALGTVRLQGELARTTAQLRMFAGVVTEASQLEVMIDHGQPSAVPPPPELRRWLVPLGPVAVFGPANFPLAFASAGGDTASALAAGCPVVYKAHSSQPETARVVGNAILRAIQRAGLPTGVFSTAYGRAAGTALVEHPAIRAVAFTGSRAGGLALMELANGRPCPIPFFGELASLNPVVVLPGAAGARAEQIAAGFVDSVTGSQGQLCTKPGLLLVPAGAAGDGIVDAVHRRAGEVSDGWMLTETIRDQYVEGVQRLGTVLGADLAPGRQGTSGGLACGPAFLEATTDDLRAHPELVDEVFGPFSLVMRYGDVVDLMTTIKSLPGSLATGLHAEPATDAAEDVGLVADLLAELSGRIVWNGFPTGVRVAWSTNHGGPFPATTLPLFTSVGATASRRFLRPVAYQGFPDAFLPDALREQPTRPTIRRVDGAIVPSDQVG